MLLFLLLNLYRYTYSRAEGDAIYELKFKLK